MVKLLSKLVLSITLLFNIAAIAQNVTLSATVQDPNGQVFQWGTYTITFAPSPGSPTPASQYYIGGNPANPVNLGPYTGALSIGGVLNVTLINGDNSLLTPAGSKWLVQVCPDVQAGGGIKSSCTQLYIALSGTQDISAQLNAVTKPISIVGLQPMATAYSDSEVDAVLDGSFYFRVVDRVVRCMSQGVWYDCLGGGGGSLSVAHNTTLVGTEPEINLNDTGTVVFTVTDNPGNSRVDISAAASGSSSATYEHNNTVVASQPALNFVDNGSVTYTVTNDAGNNRVNVQSTASGAGGSVYAEFLYPIFSTNCPLTGGTPCTDIIPTAMQWVQDVALMGPLPQTYPSANIGQNNSCGNGAIVVITCKLGSITPGDTIVGFISSIPGIALDETYTVIDSEGNTYNLIDHASGLSGIPASDVYTVAAGDKSPLTITITPSTIHGGDDAGIVANFFIIHEAGSLQQHATSTITGTSPDIILPAITTTNANNIIIGNVQVYSHAPAANSPGSGFAMVDQTSQFTSFAGGHYVTTNSEVQNVSATGTYTPHMTGDTNCCWINDQAFTLAFANTRTANIDTYTDRIIQFPDLSSSPLSPFYNANSLALATVYNDTLLDWHVGLPINHEGDSSDYTNVVLTTVGGADAAFKVGAYVDCSGSVATVTPKIIYTTAASNSITITGTAADCTSHATGSIPDQIIRAKTATTIKFTTTHTGSPTWNTTAIAEQVSLN